MAVKILNPMLHQALRYAATGIPVLPLFEPKDGGCACGDPTCKRPGKHPRTPNGVNDATTDEETIRSWWGRWRHANIGLGTGQNSKVFVVDVDGPVGQESLRRLEAENRPLWRDGRVRTGRGFHHYFRRPKNVRISNSAGKLGEGLDVRGDGGYVVAAGSFHVSGKSYRVVSRSRPARLHFLN